MNIHLNTSTIETIHTLSKVFSISHIDLSEEDYEDLKDEECACEHDGYLVLRFKNDVNSITIYKSSSDNRSIELTPQW